MHSLGGRVTSTERASNGWTSDGSQNERENVNIHFNCFSFPFIWEIKRVQWVTTTKTKQQTIFTHFPLNHFLQCINVLLFYPSLPYCSFTIASHHILPIPFHSVPLTPILLYPTHEEKKERKEGKENERTKQQKGTGGTSPPRSGNYSQLSFPNTRKNINKNNVSHNFGLGTEVCSHRDIQATNP